jgi:hypothetical protein
VSRLGVLAMGLLPGCAFVSMSGAPKYDPPGVYPVCSDRVGPWVLDALVATAAGTATASAIAEREPGIALGAGAVAGLLVGSAVYGIVTHARCRAGRGQYVEPPPAYYLDTPEIPLRGPPPAPASPPAPAPAPAPVVPYSPPAQ